MLLILDLDETLVFSSTTPLKHAADFQVEEYWVYLRPGLNTFLQFANQEFELAVWTSSGSLYARTIVAQAFPQSLNLQFLWARERCTHRVDPETRETYWIKDLKKVKRRGFRLEETLIIDDSPEKLERNFGNHIRIRPFDGQQEDNELALLEKYLHHIKSVSNVRNLEKRNWRVQVLGGLTSNRTRRKDVCKD